MGQDRTIFTQEEQILAFIADTHVHTLFSGDGSFSPEIMIEKAISLGLSHLCLTDHMDYDYTDGGICFEFDPKKYFDYILREYGQKGLNKALDATRQHIEYRKECGLTPDAIETLCDEYEQKE